MQPSRRPHPALTAPLVATFALAATAHPSAAQTEAATRVLPWPSMTIADGILLAGGLLTIGLIALAGAIAVLAVISQRRTREVFQAEGDASRAALQTEGEASRAIVQSAARTTTETLKNSQEAAINALRGDLRSGRDLLDRRADELVLTIQGRSREEAIILAESLAGELAAIESALETHLIRLDAFLSERVEASYSKVGLRDLLPRVGVPVFAAQAGRLGLLGGSLAGDVAWVYGNFQAWENLESAAATRQSTVPLEEAQQAMEAIEDVREGALHLIGRLLGFIDDRPGEITARALVRERVTARSGYQFADEDEEEADAAGAEGLGNAPGAPGAPDDTQAQATPGPDPVVPDRPRDHGDSVRITPLRPDR